MKKKNPLIDIKEYLNYKISNLKKKKKDDLKEGNLEILLRTVLSSLIIISIFFIAPIVVDFKNDKTLFSKNFENNSKDNFKKILKGEFLPSDNELDKEFLFEDVWQFDNSTPDSVRLSALTIEQLFKDTGYDLKDVRKQKLVKPVSLTLLPQEMKMIENTKKRKELFIQIILPLIIKENNHIKLDRKKLFSILNKSKNTKVEKNWLNLKFSQYGVNNKGK